MDNQIFDTVGFDNYSAGNLVARHLKSRVKKSVVSSVVLKKKNEARQRAHGFRDFIKMNPEMEINWETKGNYSVDSGIKAFEDFEVLDHKPRAIFSANDNMCQAFMKEAMVNGFNFPGDIAIVGFDDLPICKRHRPLISSVHANYELLGKITIKKLKERLRKTERPKPLLSLVPVGLKTRASS